MSTKLKAGTATSGAVIDADTTGILELQSGSTPTTAVTIDASQNVGIGTASPTGKATINYNANSAYNTGLSVYNASSGSSATVSFQLTNDAANRAGAYLTSSTCSFYGGANTFNLGTVESIPFTFLTGNAERMRIDTSGNLFLGQTAYTTPPTQTVDFFSGGLIINPSRRTTGSAANCNWDATTGVFYRSTSSLRYKTDIQDASYGLSDVLKLRPVTYKGKSETDGDKVFGGFIAEEIDALGLKQFVEYDAEGNPDSLAYANMVSLLTKAIQELNAKVEALETQLGAK